MTDQRKSLTPKMRQLLTAIDAGASITYTGWQELWVNYGPRDERNYSAREQTLYALRDRGLVTLGKNGIARVGR